MIRRRIGLLALVVLLCAGCSSIFNPGIPKAVGEWDGTSYTNEYFNIALDPSSGWVVSENTALPAETDGYYRQLDGEWISGGAQFSVAFYAANAEGGADLDRLVGEEHETVRLAGQNFAVAQTEENGMPETHYYLEKSDTVLDLCLRGDEMDADLIDLRATLRPAKP